LEGKYLREIGELAIEWRNAIFFTYYDRPNDLKTSIPPRARIVYLSGPPRMFGSLTNTTP
jgi:hypothetical protein